MTAALVGIGVGAVGGLVTRALAQGRSRDLLRRLGSGVVDGGSGRRLQLWRPAAVAGTGLLGAAVGFHLAGPIGACAGVGAVLLGRSLRARAQEVRWKRGLEQGTVEIAAAMAAAARAGRSVRRSLEEAAWEAPAAVRPALDTALAGMAMGQALPDVLARLRRDLVVPEAGLLVAVLEVHRRSGGDLPAALDRVADLVRRRTRARRRLRALSAQGRASGAVLAVLPAAFVGLLSGTSGNGLGDFYRSSPGSLLLLVGSTLTGAGFLWIRAILRRAEP